MPPRHEIAPIIDAWFVGSKNWTSRSFIPYEMIAVIKYVSQMSANVQRSHILFPSIFKYSLSCLLFRLTSVRALFSYIGFSCLIWDILSIKSRALTTSIEIILQYHWIPTLDRMRCRKLTGEAKNWNWNKDPNKSINNEREPPSTNPIFIWWVVIIGFSLGKICPKKCQTHRSYNDTHDWPEEWSLQDFCHGSRPDIQR